MGDPLAQYRKTTASMSAQTAPPKGPDEYVAFDVKDKIDRLTVLRANDPARSPGYAYLLDVVYDDAGGTNFVLVYSFLMVLVRGKNLHPLFTALKMGTASFIQEFDAKRWQKPKETEPFISSIEVVVQQSGPSISESEGPGKPGRNLH